jgi:hypothetical protein
MSHNDAYDESTSFRNAPTAQEVRFLMQGLHQLAIDPHAEVPAHFHAAVMAKAQQLPLPRKRLWPQVGRRLTVWVPVLAVGLLLSLGVHIWQGLRTVGPQPPGARQEAGKPLESRMAAGSLSIYQFQAQMQHPNALGSVVAARPVPQLPRAMVGFTPHATRKTFVYMGILYADMLAALQSGAVQAAAHRLHLLTQALASIQAPPALPQYLREMHTLLQQQLTTDKTTVQFVALFEPLYAHVYATDPTTAAWVLFQTGAWLENLSLAAAAGDQAAVRQAQAMQSWRDALRPLNMPRAVLDDLEQLHGLVARQPLTAEDLSAIQTLVDTIKTQLSE